MPDLVGDELRVQILQDKTDARALLALGKRGKRLAFKENGSRLRAVRLQDGL